MQLFAVEAVLVVVPSFQVAFEAVQLPREDGDVREVEPWCMRFLDG